MDILATLEELEDDEFNEESEEVLVGSVMELDDELSLDDYEMSEEQAKDITDAIRSAATATYVLLRQAHEHKAHKALGYDTWETYVRAEFDMSAQRSYQLLNLDRTIAMIEEATPEGTEVKLTEKQARDIKRELPRITERIQEETADLTPEEAAARAAEILKEEQAEVRSQQLAEDKARKAKEVDVEQAERDGYEAGLEAAADALLEADRADGMTDIADDGLLEMEVSGDQGSVEDHSGDNYNFFTMFNAFALLPSPDEMVGMIQTDREQEIDDSINEATAWLNRFATLWEMRHQN